MLLSAASRSPTLPCVIALALEDRVELGADLGDLRKTHLVDFVRREVGGRRLAQRLGVDRVAVREAPRAVARTGRRPQLSIAAIWRSSAG